jgi:hypothetical protein
MLVRNVLLPVCLVLSACGETPPPPTAGNSFEVVTDVHHTMELILDPAADLLWSSAGSIITAEGSTELHPTTDEGWHAVESAAAVLAETGNLLVMPGRSAGADWDKYADGLRRTGKLAMQAALDQDPEALFDAGGEIYQVCKACHNQYWVNEGRTTDQP